MFNFSSYGKTEIGLTKKTRDLIKQKNKKDEEDARKINEAKKYRESYG